MIKQMKYFEAIVRRQSFTKAADECYISQSAISQQIQALEKELGVKLLLREGRKFSLTPAGDFFYKKSLVLVNDFEKLCRAISTLANGGEQSLSIGYLRYYKKFELTKTIAQLTEKFPDLSINLVQGTHEELYDLLRTDKIDVVINDLRRKPSDQYVNFFLNEENFYIEIPRKNPLAQLNSITADDFKNTPMILIAPPGERLNEEIFYREYFGIKSEFIFAENLDDAHLMTVAGKGFLPLTFQNAPTDTDFVKYIPLIYQGKPVTRKYFVFWHANSARQCIEDFAETLKANFNENIA